MENALAHFETSALQDDFQEVHCRSSPNCRVRELRRSVFAESTEQDMVPLFVRS